MSKINTKNWPQKYIVRCNYTQYYNNNEILHIIIIIIQYLYSASHYKAIKIIQDTNWYEVKVKKRKKERKEKKERIWYKYCQSIK
jgi:hypothetical protein